MATETETPAKAKLQQRAAHEIKELLILTVYLCSSS